MSKPEPKPVRITINAEGLAGIILALGAKTGGSREDQLKCADAIEDMMQNFAREAVNAVFEEYHAAHHNGRCEGFENKCKCFYCKSRGRLHDLGVI